MPTSLDSSTEQIAEIIDKLSKSWKLSKSFPLALIDSIKMQLY